MGASVVLSGVIRCHQEVRKETHAASTPKVMSKAVADISTSAAAAPAAGGAGSEAGYDPTGLALVLLLRLAYASDIAIFKQPHLFCNLSGLVALEFVALPDVAGTLRKRWSCRVAACGIWQLLNSAYHHNISISVRAAPSRVLARGIGVKVNRLAGSHDAGTGAANTSKGTVVEGFRTLVCAVEWSALGS
jgi:hypothetical protein